MEHNLTRYTVTVEGCPFAAQYDSNLMGCMIAEYVKQRIIGDHSEAPYLKTVDLTCRGTIRSGEHEYEDITVLSVTVPDFEAQERAEAWATAEAAAQARREERERADAAEREAERARDALGYAGWQEPDPRPGPYYVSAVRQGDDGSHGWYAMMGPFETHAEAITLVDRVKVYANAVDFRSSLYAFGTKRHPYPDDLPTGKITLAQLEAWETARHQPETPKRGRRKATSAHER